MAGIAIFTAIRLYQLRSESVAPTAPDTSEAASEWPECQLGEPTHNTSACRARAEQYKGISGPPDPSDGAWFTWAKAEPNILSGDTACGLAPTMCAEAESCKELAFSLTTPSTTPSSTPTGTATPTPTSTPTSTPTGTPAPTSTSTPVPTATPTTPIGGGEDPTPTPTSTTTTTPTDSQIAQVSPTTSPDQLPAAGVGYPTIMLSLFGMLIIFFAIALAI